MKWRNHSRKQPRATLRLCLTVSLVAIGYYGFIDTGSLPAQNQKQKNNSSQRPKPTPTPASPGLKTLGPPPPVPTLSIRPEDIKPGDVISVNTNEVMLPVTVRDARGRLVSDLSRNDFKVFEDGRDQPLNDLALRQVPVDVVLMVDASSSVAQNLDDFRRAVDGFATRLAPEDRISLIKFDDRVELVQDWTQSRFQLHRALSRIEPGMFTRFNDALLLAAKQQFASNKSRRAIIVLSDGIDSGRGVTTFEMAVQTLLQAQAVVYVVSNTEIQRAIKKAELDSMSRGSESEIRFNELKVKDLEEGLRVLDASEERLSQLTVATGGRLYKPTSFDALDSTYAEVADELRHQYALYYTPLNKTRDGSFRRVRVEITTPSYTATTRVGYFAARN
jgi:Ca-activated chloride channel family protein